MGGARCSISKMIDDAANANNINPAILHANAKLLPVEIALVLIFVASYLVYSDQCDVLDSLRTAKSEVEGNLD
jgi:hypothetical protein